MGSGLSARDVEAHVRRSLDGHAGQFDIAAITAALISEHGIQADYPDDAFWGVVASHDTGPKPAPAARLAADLGPLMQATPAGHAAETSSGPVTIRVTGHARARQWPNIRAARIVLTTPDGAQVTLTGDRVASWESLHGEVSDAEDGWVKRGTDLSRAAEQASADCRAAQARLTRAVRALAAHHPARSAAADPWARLDEIGAVAAWAEQVIDAALLGGIPAAEVARRTGRDRAGLHRRRAKLLAHPDRQ